MVLKGFTMRQKEVVLLLTISNEGLRKTTDVPPDKRMCRWKETCSQCHSRNWSSAVLWTFAYAFTTEMVGPQAQMSFARYEKSLPFFFPYVLCVDFCWWEQFWGTNILPPQQASYHPDVSGEVRERALRFGTECTLGYLELLEHVLLVRSHLHAHTGFLPRRILSLVSFYSSC